MLLINMGEIAAFCRRNPSTIKRWIHGYGFPAAKLPSGEWATDVELIRRWILARHEASLNPQWNMAWVRRNQRDAELVKRIEAAIRQENRYYGVPDHLGIAPEAFAKNLETSVPEQTGGPEPHSPAQPDPVSGAACRLHEGRAGRKGYPRVRRQIPGPLGTSDNPD